MSAQTLTELVRRGALLSPGAPHVALVSGGRDSVCLLDVLAQLCGPGALVALHVNYHLRGEHSEGDERHVLGLCERLGVECVVHSAPPPPARGNLHAWARDVRYARASMLAASRSAHVATGHTASDQAETVLYRLAASPGRRALLGMRPRDGLLVRPLLAATREQTAAHCRARGLSWREDASNDDPRFARARVRGGLLAELRRVAPAAEANVVRTAQLLRDEADVLDALLEQTLAGRRSIPLEQLAQLPPALARLLVTRLAEDVDGASAVPGAAARLDSLLALGGRGGSARLDLGGGVRAVVEYGVLRFEAAAEPPPIGEVALELPGAVCFGAWELGARVQAGGLELLEHGGEEGLALLDADRLDGPLRVRAWRAGDRMRPLGLGGSRSLADLFVDRRVPRGERTRVPVLTSGGEIAWVARCATGERFRVTAATRRVALITARSHGDGAP